MGLANPQRDYFAAFAAGLTQETDRCPAREPTQVSKEP